MSRLTRSTTKALSVSPKERTESPLPRTRRGITPDMSATPSKETPAKLRTRRASLADTPQELPGSPLRRSRRFSTTSDEVGTPTKTRNLRNARTNLTLVEQPVPEEEELKRDPSPPKRARKRRSLANTPNESDVEKDDKSPERAVEKDDENNQDKKVAKKASKQTSPEHQTMRSTTSETPKKCLRSSVVFLKKLGGKLDEDAVKPSSGAKRTFKPHSKVARSHNKIDTSEDDSEEEEISKVSNDVEKKGEKSSMSDGEDRDEENKTNGTDNIKLNPISQLDNEVGDIEDVEDNCSKDGHERRELAIDEAFESNGENMEDVTTEKSAENERISSDIIESKQDVSSKDIDSPTAEINVLEAETESRKADVSKNSPQKSVNNQSPEKCPKNQTDYPRAKFTEGASPNKTDSLGDLNRSSGNESKHAQSETSMNEGSLNETPTKSPEKMKTIFARSWNQSIKGPAKEDGNSPEFIDAISMKRSSILSDTSPGDSLTAKKTPEVTPEKRQQQFGSSTSENEDEEDEEASTRRADFIDDEAMEVSDGENSLNSSERAYLEANEIPVDGESLGSENTSEEGDDDEDGSGKEEMGSFIVSESEIDKLSGNDSLLGSEDEIDVPKKRFSRIIQDDTSSDEEIPETEKLDAIKAGANENEPADSTEQVTDNLSPKQVINVSSDGGKMSNEECNEENKLEAGIQFLRSISDTCQKIINEQNRAGQLTSTADEPPGINKSYVEGNSVNVSDKKTVDSQEEYEIETTIRSSTITDETCQDSREIDSEVEFLEPNDGQGMNSSKVASSKVDVTAVLAESKETINESSTVDANSEPPSCKNDAAEDTKGKLNTSKATKSSIAETSEGSGDRIERSCLSGAEANVDKRNEVSALMKSKIYVESSSESDEEEDLRDIDVSRKVNVSNVETIPESASSYHLSTSIDKANTSAANLSNNAPNMNIFEKNQSNETCDSIEDTSDGSNDQMEPQNEAIELTETLLTKGDISGELEPNQVDTQIEHIKRDLNNSQCSIENSVNTDKPETLAKSFHDGDNDIAKNSQIGTLPHNSNLSSSSREPKEYSSHAEIDIGPSPEKNLALLIDSEEPKISDSSQFTMNQSDHQIEDQKLVDNGIKQQESNQMDNNKNRKSWPVRIEKENTISSRASLNVSENKHSQFIDKKFGSCSASIGIGIKHKQRSSSSKSEANVCSMNSRKSSEKRMSVEVNNRSVTGSARSENESTIGEESDSMRSLNNSVNISHRQNVTNESSYDSKEPSKNKESGLVGVENEHVPTDSDSDAIDDVVDKNATVAAKRVSEDCRESSIEKEHSSMRSLNSTVKASNRKIFSPANESSDDSDVPSESQKSCLAIAEKDNANTDSDSDAVDDVNSRQVTVLAKSISEKQRKSKSGHNSIRSLNSSLNVTRRKTVGPTNESSDDSEVSLENNELLLLRAEKEIATSDSDSKAVDDVDTKGVSVPVRRASEIQRRSLIEKRDSSNRSLNKSLNISQRNSRHSINESNDDSEVSTRSKASVLLKAEKESETTDSDSDVDNEEIALLARRLSENRRQSKGDNEHGSNRSVNNSLTSMNKRRVENPRNESGDDDDSSIDKVSCSVKVKSSPMTCEKNDQSNENATTCKTMNGLTEGQESEEGSSVSSEESENDLKNHTLGKREILENNKREGNLSLNESHVSKSKNTLGAEKAIGNNSKKFDRLSGQHSRLRIEDLDESSESSDSDYDINEFVLPTDVQRKNKLPVMPKRKAKLNQKPNKLPSSSTRNGSLTVNIRNKNDKNAAISSSDDSSNSGNVDLPRKKIKQNRIPSKNVLIKAQTSCKKHDVTDSDSDDIPSIITAKKNKNMMSLTWPKSQVMQTDEYSDESTSKKQQFKSLTNDGKSKTSIRNDALKHVSSKKNIFSRCSDNTFGNASKLDRKKSKKLAKKVAVETKSSQSLDDSTTRDLDSIINTAQKQVIDSEDNKSLLNAISKLVSKSLKTLSKIEPEELPDNTKTKAGLRHAKKSSRHDLNVLGKPSIKTASHQYVEEKSSSSESVDSSKIKNLSAKTENMLFKKLAAKSHSTPANQEKVKIKLNDRTLASNDEYCEPAIRVFNEHATCNDISFVINDAKKRVRRDGEKQTDLTEKILPAKKKRKVAEPPTEALPSSDNSFENYLPSNEPLKKGGVVKNKRIAINKPKKFGQESKILQEMIMNRIQEAKQKGKIVTTEANVQVGKPNPNIPNEAAQIVSAFAAYSLQKKGKKKHKSCDDQDVLELASKKITGNVENKKRKKEIQKRANKTSNRTETLVNRVQNVTSNNQISTTNAKLISKHLIKHNNDTNASIIQESASSCEVGSSSYQTSDTSDTGRSKSKSKQGDWHVTGGVKSKKTLSILGKLPSEILARSVNQKKAKGADPSYVPTKTIGAKVRTILSAGQKEIPIVDRKSSKSKLKNKYGKEKDPPKSPQQVWTSIGCFQVSDASYIAASEKNQIRPESYGAKTMFAVQTLKNNKRKASEAAEIYSSTALNFKRQALCNDKIQRESSKDLLRKKLKKKY